MAESNREPPLCPCGFWGSPQTCGLCSKCYKEMMQKKEHDVSLSSSCQGSNQVTPSSPAPPAVTTPPIQVIVSENSQSSDPSMDSAPSSVASDGATCRPDEASISSSEAGCTPANDDPDRPVQKNKKRCFKCRCRLELAFVEIGRCKCDYVFCELHRLPEQHDCTYNHKEKGRQEAREKMISPKKHVGTSLKRLDSDA